MFRSFVREKQIFQRDMFKRNSQQFQVARVGPAKEISGGLTARPAWVLVDSWDDGIHKVLMGYNP